MTARQWWGGSVSITVGREDAPRTETVHGYTNPKVPGLAITVSTERDDTVAKRFAITHVPTGRLIGDWVRLETAKVIVLEMAAIHTWTDPLPPVELQPRVQAIIDRHSRRKFRGPRPLHKAAEPGI